MSATQNVIYLYDPALYETSLIFRREYRGVGPCAHPLFLLKNAVGCFMFI